MEASSACPNATPDDGLNGSTAIEATENLYVAKDK